MIEQVATQASGINWTNIFIIAGFVIAWIACGIYNYGRSFAYFQRKYPNLANMDYKDDKCYAIINGIAGFLALPAVLIVCSPSYGFKWK
jgi:hypothetical protein